MRSPWFLTLLSALLFFARPASADETNEDRPKDVAAPEAPSTGFLSFSPLHLTQPILEINAEARLDRHWGAAAILGAGTLSRRTYFDAGAQLLGYPIGNFDRGIQLGLEVSYASYPGEREPIVLIGPVNVFAISPLVGAKWTLPNGFGVSSQAGVTWAPAATGERVSTLYNLNVGWAF